MKSVTILFVCLLALGIGSVQHVQGATPGLTVVSTVPANLATSVSAATTTVSITFSDVVDTTLFPLQGKGSTGCIISNFDSLTGVSFSGDHKTVILTVKLSAGNPYFAAVYSAKSAGQVPMPGAYVFHFTTASSFPPGSVSGTVASGSSGVPTAGSFVALSNIPLSQGDPVFVAGVIADGAGNFTIPYVPNGTFYPLAAKDVTGDGSIDPSNGDVVGTANGVTVNGAGVTGVTITFASTQPFSFTQAADSLNARVAGFPSPHTLRVVLGYSLDTTGRGGWEFDYTGSNLQTSFVFRMESFGGVTRPMDSSQYNWIRQVGAITALPTPAVVDSFLARTERSGGAAYRPVPMTWNGFDVRLFMGKLYWQGFGDMLPDTTNYYLAATYWYGIDGQNTQTTTKQKRFLGNYTTGAILGTTGVSPSVNGGIPGTYGLGQNYPNPFNPATKISYSLPAASNVELRVYNMLGQEVATLVNGTVAAGSHTVSFDGTRLSSGIYVYRLTAGKFVSTMKMVLVK